MALRPFSRLPLDHSGALAFVALSGDLTLRRGPLGLVGRLPFCLVGRLPFGLVGRLPFGPFGGLALRGFPFSPRGGLALRGFPFSPRGGLALRGFPLIPLGRLPFGPLSRLSFGSLSRLSFGSLSRLSFGPLSRCLLHRLRGLLARVECLFVGLDRLTDIGQEVAAASAERGRRIVPGAADLAPDQP